MENHSCHTYFAIYPNFDQQKNRDLLLERLDCLPEEIGILNKNEIEKFIIETFHVNPIWDRHHFLIGYNEEYHVNVNEMLRVTLKDLLGKENQLRELKEKFSVEMILEVVPHIVADSHEPTPILSIEKDIVEFLYRSDSIIDLDYYLN